MGKISAAFNKQYLVANFLDKISACFWTARFLGRRVSTAEGVVYDFVKKKANGY